jgi:hypothetical protein
MHTGTLINDLIATVERAERLAQQPTDSTGQEYGYSAAPYQLVHVEQNLLGVA